jgi:8-hydroxy-5-deazaflavin:NADPH oxidoreductase
MHVTVIGTGNMARGIGRRLLAGGHDLTIVGQDTEAAEAVVRDLGAEDAAQVARSGDPVADNVVVLAIYFPDAKAFVEQNREVLAGKLLIDITNPVNDTYDALVTPPDGSAAQELAASAPGSQVVKAFNTTFAGTLSEGEVAGQPLDVLIAGDDDEAKATVARLVEDGRMRAVDAGPLKRARELEAAGLLHITVQDSLGSGGGSALKFLL